MKINITDSVLAGNLGDGWMDEWKVAKALAQELTDDFESDIHDRYPDAEISVTITPERSSGYKCEPSIWIDGAGDEEFEMIEKITEILSDTARETWDRFCSEYTEED